jgi:hypothetical protein
VRCAVSLCDHRESGFVIIAVNRAVWLQSQSFVTFLILSDAARAMCDHRDGGEESQVCFHHAPAQPSQYVRLSRETNFCIGLLNAVKEAEVLAKTEPGEKADASNAIREAIKREIAQEGDTALEALQGLYTRKVLIQVGVRIEEESTEAETEEARIAEEGTEVTVIPDLLEEKDVKDLEDLEKEVLLIAAKGLHHEALLLQRREEVENDHPVGHLGTESQDLLLPS